MLAAACTPGANTSVDETAQKLRFWVLSLRSAAPHLGRWASRLYLIPNGGILAHE